MADVGVCALLNFHLQRGLAVMESSYIPDDKAMQEDVHETEASETRHKGEGVSVKLSPPGLTSEIKAQIEVKPGFDPALLFQVASALVSLC